MSDSVDFSGRPFHFIGIGGIGMSALAYILVKRKLPVSGSDLRLTHITQKLQDLGAHIFWNQEATNLEYFQATANLTEALPAPTEVSGSSNGSRSHGTLNGAVDGSKPKAKPNLKSQASLLPQVICSTAIGVNNPEYRAALDLGCPIFHRSDVLAALIREHHSIAVAGTHGKTTTSSLIGYLLMESGLDPTIVVGGEVDAWGGNARMGESPYLVAEADESDGSLVKFESAIGVITNIELDHPDHYHSLEQLTQTFQKFASQCQIVVGCMDCQGVQNLKPQMTYSLNGESGADYIADKVVYGPAGTTARIWERHEVLGQLTLPLLGKHNLSNALAAIAVGRLLDLDFPVIARAISTFQGAHRRFEHRGEANRILFVDDYAHHPSEIEVTLAAAQLHIQGKLTGVDQRRVVAIFQPHRYSRTQTFLAEFAQSFKDADLVVVTDIYSAGEANSGNLTGQQVADAIAAYHGEVYFQPSLNSVSAFLNEVLQAGDLALFLGAGNLNQIIPDVLAYQRNLENSLPQKWCNQA
ncbi:UDP-N-acetylmuramate--L-alanine ligase [Leptolyngbya sp. 'hensonii']|uniref:UDP-N-acetylmuramate--L-alanine ligase n=1 Tax=Leptolyngbya sp. 'hensonii' TaxID=1922337 RepID=UPI00094F9FEB|nr:UDP-N-acetylmuramate--L-alanine ligase [Leptolyngbya sp. 'hensonii']OLP20161.1 UDP-N-acetylmuramate--L-alanine ligase [Leptolyngbya sp. 'hensonii']